MSSSLLGSVDVLKILQVDLDAEFAQVRDMHEKHHGVLRRQACRVARLVGEQKIEAGDVRFVFLLSARHLDDASCPCTQADATAAIDEAIALALVDAVLAPIRLISFGYLHLDGAPTPRADRTEDVRDRLRDPAAARDILDLDGRDPRVQTVVLNTPGARELLANLADYSRLPAGPRAIAIGCAGGRHRAASLVELLAHDLQARGRVVEIEHRHIHLPRVLKAGEGQ
ncbi:RapZ C-terminal domain-containing protein [Amycolatopsis keratiniphila]|uniref:RapZ C-terminal domain-containing protein n=1 Tax=Amycolatopsis keratiniphila TaxID=129921 RepID=W6HY49_9PSEU|nr:RNase adapter RapZ [Amycolatopsis keratiniphila]AHJ58533.1 hypothetical protein AORI_P018 [Amycolatopsis keratiniphila]